MRASKIILGIIVALAVIYFVLALVVLPSLNSFQTEGVLKLKGLKKPVKVLRDEKGMAYIYADNLPDAIFAQGFVAAQDRLFQMQLTRLFAQGRISELAGKRAKPLDIMHRVIGIHRAAKKHAELLDAQTKAYIQRYVDGINAFIRTTPGDIPLEFKLAGIKPERWSIEDSLSILYYMGWSTSANLKTEIITQMLVEKLGPEKAREIFPININPDDPTDTGEIKLSGLGLESDQKFGLKLDNSLLSFCESSALRLGSNNWAVSPKLSKGGKTILAGDPHLDARILPGPWYPCGIITPECRIIGANIPGIPGTVIGRTDNIALAMTNSYADVQDLYVETVDPKNPNNYLEGDKSIPFQVIEETIKIKDKKAAGGYKKEKLKIRFTKRGPVISGVFPGLKTDKVITLRWAAQESMQPEIGLGYKVFNAKNVDDIRDSLRNFTMITLNFVIADSTGNIAWHVSGKIPIRSAGSGTVPYVVKDGTDNWTGWIPFEQMPHSKNPKRGWVGTCNHKTVDHTYPYYFSSYFSTSYRYRRLKELLDKPSPKSLDDHWKYQRDNFNVMAKSLAPIMAKALLSYDDTKQMREILSKWDFKDDPDKVAPTVFQAVYLNFARLVFVDELGPKLTNTMLNTWYFWQERLQKMVLNGSSPWFDNVQTKDKKETMQELFHTAALDARKMLDKKIGSDINKWQWGNVHKIQFVNPIRRKGFGKDLLGSGPHSMGGSGETLYRALYGFSKPFNVTISASMRMVVDFADNDKIMAVLAGGVCGRTFNDHQKDQVEPFMNGNKVYWWFSDKQINKHARTTLKLQPK